MKPTVERIRRLFYVGTGAVTREAAFVPPRGVLRHQVLDLLDDPVVVLEKGQTNKVVDAAAEAVPIHGDVLPDADLGVRRGLHVLALDPQLLEELLARTQAGEDDLDVLAGPEAAERDQLLGQVHDLDRLAHVEDEDLAALAHGGGLEDQLAGLRDGHEVALHLRDASR